MKILSKLKNFGNIKFSPQIPFAKRKDIRIISFQNNLELFLHSVFYKVIIWSKSLIKMNFQIEFILKNWNALLNEDLAVEIG